MKGASAVTKLGKDPEKGVRMERQFALKQRIMCER
jgi:hypothetical protein